MNDGLNVYIPRKRLDVDHFQVVTSDTSSPAFAGPGHPELLLRAAEACNAEANSDSTFVVIRSSLRLAAAKSV